MLSIFLNSLFLYRFLIYPLSLFDSLLVKAWSEISVIIFRWIGVISILSLLFFGFFCGEIGVI